jgi:hypothetical protein
VEHRLAACFGFCAAARVSRAYLLLSKVGESSPPCLGCAGTALWTQQIKTLMNAISAESAGIEGLSYHSTAFLVLPQFPQFSQSRESWDLPAI